MEVCLGGFVNPESYGESEKMQNASKQRKQPTQQKKKKTARAAAKREPRVQAPVATSRIKTTPAPRVDRSKKNGDIVVRHREFIGDINGSVAFAVNSFAVNPGLPTTFPWLANQAALYESYRFNKLSFEFQTMSSTATPGTVMAAIDYDPADSAPVSKTQLAAYRKFVRSAPWQDFANHSLKEDLSKRKSYFVRRGAIPANQDVQLFDTGNLFLATQGQADAAAVGELYVDYEVELMTPQLGDPAIGLSLSSVVTWATAASQGVASPGSNAPLVASTSGGTFRLTATSAYDGLVNVRLTSTSGAETGIDTSSSTCTIEQPFSAMLNTTTVLYTGQLAFTPGQVFSFDPVVGAISSAVASLGQFNTPAL